MLLGARGSSSVSVVRTPSTGKSAYATSKDSLTMKPALYLSCALLIGPAFHAQSTLFYTHGGVGAIAHPFMPASGYDDATDFDAQAPTPAPPSAQNSAGQNSRAQEPTPQDAL